MSLVTSSIRPRVGEQEEIGAYILSKDNQNYC